MIKVIGVRFRTAGKIYFFDPLEFDVKRNDHVIVETARGVEYGTVVGDPRMVTDDQVIQPLKPVIRIATKEDDAQEAVNKGKEKEAFKICLEKIQKHGLEMKLIDAEYTFDNNKVLFYFTADGRIDFRELVKDLASVFRTRIELRQIGVRDETKILGGIGICGRPLCCHAHLSEFLPVSIKMAKEQNLSLNPTKISGVCGRLMCCLKHEEETYEELNKKLPNVGDFVTTSDGLKGEVHSVSVLRQLVKIIVDNEDEKEIKEYHVDDLKFKKRHKKENMDLTPEELRELQKMEQEDINDSKNEEAQNHKGKGNQGRDNRNNHNRDNNRDRNNDNRDNNKEKNNGNRDNNKEKNNDNRDNNKDRNNDNRDNNKEKNNDNRDNNRDRNKDNRNNNRENNKNKDFARDKGQQNQPNNKGSQNNHEDRPETK